MRSLELAKRNFKEVWKDPISLGIAIVLPIGLLFILAAVGNGIGEADAPALTATSLTPGVALFGFVMLMFSSAMILSRDRETSLLARLLTAPLRSWEFVMAYSLPFLAVAVLQGIVLFLVGGLLGLEISGSIGFVFLVLFSMAVCYIGLGMILGSIFTVKQVSGGYTVILLLTIFGGTWFELSDIGGAFETVGNALPFAHALNATRSVMLDGAGFIAISTDFYWVLGYTVAAAGLAVFSFRRRMVE